MISTGLLSLMPELKNALKATTYTFFGVGEQRL